MTCTEKVISCDSLILLFVLSSSFWQNSLRWVGRSLGPYLHKELRPITTHWRYLGLWLDPSLKFQYHAKFYANRAFSLGTCLRLLSNSSRGLNLVYKCRLYLSNIFPIMTYGCQMWMNPKLKGQKGLVKLLLVVYYNACRWITGAFKTTPLGSLDVLAGLIPI